MRESRTNQPLFLGIDCGTSAVRALLAARGKVYARAEQPLESPIRSLEGEVRQDPRLWWRACEKALATLAQKASLSTVRAVSICGTSGTILLADEKGEAISTARMYNDLPPQKFREQTREQTREQAREQTKDFTSSNIASFDALARLLALYEECRGRSPRYAVLQADYLLSRLGAPLGRSDDNNCLKLGYDSNSGGYSPWIERCAPQLIALLPRVDQPGSEIGRVSKTSVDRFGLSPSCVLCAGTTDGVAAFIASGQEGLGRAATSLGSTLTLKIVCDKPIADKDYGVYSHRLGDRWLAGGASNSGGMAIRQFFSPEQITHLSDSLRPSQPTGLAYYPLPAVGERFPVNDPTLKPCFAPRPRDERIFLQAILEGIAAIEKRAYDRLSALGAPRLLSVATLGGGAGNEAWRQIREQRLGVPVSSATHSEAAFGSARLAANMAF